METIAYLELAQDYEHSESKEIKLSGKAVATTITLASTAWAGGLLTAAPVLAYGSGCCRPVVQRPVGCCRPVVVRPIVIRPVVVRPVVSSCFQPCYYPQSNYSHYDSGSYYPDYYSYDHSYEQSYDECDCYSDNGSSGGDYHEIAFHPVTDQNLLQLGSAGDIVALLQQALLDLGFDPGPVDGLYGHQTAEAVAQYQASAGLLVDGVAGGQTLDSLGLAGAGA